jgi:Rod binding domain-containing protein
MTPLAAPALEQLTQPAAAPRLSDRIRGAGQSPEAAKKAAIEFESVFISQMLAPMFDGISSDGPFGGGSGEKVYRSLMVDEYGKLIAKSGGIGLADSVMREILKHQERA